MKILMIIPSLQVGGAEIFFARLARGLMESHSVRAYTQYLCYTNPAILKMLGDVPVHGGAWTRSCVRRLASQLRKAWRISTGQDLFKRWEIAKLRTLQSQHRFDLVNPHLAFPELRACEAFLNDGVPIAVTDHGDYRLNSFRELAATMEGKRLFSRTDAVIYPSLDNERIGRTIPRKPQCIEQRIFYGLPPLPRSSARPLILDDGSFVFGMVARGIPEKGWAPALMAFQQLLKRTERPIKLVFVGDSEHLQALRAGLDRTVANSVIFAGEQSQPQDWISLFNVGLLPTTYAGDSLPNSVIEYLSLGKPVLATPQGGIPEMLQTSRGMAGAILPISNGGVDSSLLEEEMHRMLTDNAWYEEATSRTSEASERFTMPACLRAYEGLFLQLIDQRAKR